MKNFPLLISLLFLTQFSFGQKNFFGITLGVQGDFLALETSDLSKSPIEHFSSKSGFGFSIGIVSEHFISKKWSISPKPSIAFSNHHFNYKYIGQEAEEFQKELVIVQLPVDLHYHFLIKNVESYFLGGGQYSLVLGQQETLTLGYKKHLLGFGFGMGAKKNMKHFLLIPELKFAITPSQLLTNDNFFFQQAIHSLRFNQLTFSLKFMGHDHKTIRLPDEG